MMSPNMILSDKEITISERHPLSAVRGKGEEEEPSFDRKRRPAEPRGRRGGRLQLERREKRRDKS